MTTAFARSTKKVKQPHFKIDKKAVSEAVKRLQHEMNEISNFNQPMSERRR